MVSIHSSTNSLSSLPTLATRYCTLVPITCARYQIFNLHLCVTWPLNHFVHCSRDHICALSHTTHARTRNIFTALRAPPLAIPLVRTSTATSHTTTQFCRLLTSDRDLSREMAPFSLRSEIRKRPWTRAGYVRFTQPNLPEDNSTCSTTTDLRTTHHQSTASLTQAAASFAIEKRKKEEQQQQQEPQQREDEERKDQKVRRPCGCRTRCNKYGVMAGCMCRVVASYFRRCW